MSITNKLTDAACKKLAAQATDRKYPDGNGMYLLVTSKGAKLWRMAYRWQGKAQTASFGPLELVTLKQARELRHEIRVKLNAGVDPKARPVVAKSKTVSQAVATWLEVNKNLSPVYLAKIRGAMAYQVEPYIGRLPMHEVTHEDVLVVLKRIDATGAHTQVRNIRGWLGQMWDIAIAEKYCEHNYPRAISPRIFVKPLEEHMPTLALPEVPAFLQRLELEPRTLSSLGLRMLMMTWVRTQELRNMKWSQIDGDGVWTIPKHIMKARQDHMVPLPQQARAILEEIRSISRGGEYVFHGERSITDTMSKNAIIYLIHRMGYRGRMSGHGCRAMGSTWANECGFNPNHTEVQLAHKDDNKVRGAYNKAKYLDERAELLDAYADWLDRCLQHSDASLTKRGGAPAKRAQAQADVGPGQLAQA